MPDASDAGILGRCPSCGASVPNGSVLITYRRADGSTGRFAACHDCEDVVQPV